MQWRIQEIFPVGSPLLQKKKRAEWVLNMGPFSLNTYAFPLHYFLLIGYGFTAYYIYGFTTIFLYRILLKFRSSVGSREPIARTIGPPLCVGMISKSYNSGLTHNLCDSRLMVPTAFLDT